MPCKVMLLDSGPIEWVGLPFQDAEIPAKLFWGTTGGADPTYTLTHNLVQRQGYPSARFVGLSHRFPKVQVFPRADSWAEMYTASHGFPGPGERTVLKRIVSAEVFRKIVVWAKNQPPLGLRTVPAEILALVGYALPEGTTWRYPGNQRPTSETIFGIRLVEDRRCEAYPHGFLRENQDTGATGALGPIPHRDGTRAFMEGRSPAEQTVPLPWDWPDSIHHTADSVSVLFHQVPRARLLTSYSIRKGGAYCPRYGKLYATIAEQTYRSTQAAQFHLFGTSKKDGIMVQPFTLTTNPGVGRGLSNNRHLTCYNMGLADPYRAIPREVRDVLATFIPGAARDDLRLSPARHTLAGVPPEQLANWIYQYAPRASFMRALAADTDSDGQQKVFHKRVLDDAMVVTASNGTSKEEIIVVSEDPRYPEGSTIPRKCKPECKIPLSANEKVYFNPVLPNRLLQ